MNSRLVRIAGVSLSVSAVCALAVVLTSTTGLVDVNYRSWAAAARGCAAKKASSGEPRTVDLAWSGSDAVKIRIPARVHFQPGPKPQASVSGDAELVGHVRMRNGTLEWDTFDDAIDHCFPVASLVVRLAGPAVPAWTLNGSGEVDLSDIKQDTLRITTHGSSTVTANGEVHDVSLEASGSSRIDLSRLVAQQASARIHGSADVDLAPRDDADISISGSGVVRLHGAAPRIRSHVSGSGQIKQVP
jgi:Putative auto-transporter adhesin, head GIN domain